MVRKYLPNWPRRREISLPFARQGRKFSDVFRKLAENSGDFETEPRNSEDLRRCNEVFSEDFRR